MRRHALTVPSRAISRPHRVRWFSTRWFSFFGHLHATRTMGLIGKTLPASLPVEHQCAFRKLLLARRIRQIDESRLVRLLLLLPPLVPPARIDWILATALLGSL